jgi:hypothetical protein
MIAPILGLIQKNTSTTFTSERCLEVFRIGIPFILRLIGNIPKYASEMPLLILCRHLKPDGFIEHFEISPQIKSDDGTVTKDSLLNQFSKVSQTIHLPLLCLFCAFPIILL